MELGLEVTGRKSKELVAEIVGPLSEHELALVTTEKGIKAPPLQKMRQRHHLLAQKLAKGMAHGEAAIQVGLEPARVSILLTDPSFKELVEHYSKVENELREEATEIVYQEMSGLSIDSLRELSHRLENDPDSISNGQLMEIAKLTTDRTGFGPQSNQNINVHIGLADRLKVARERVAERIKQIDLVPDGEENT